MKKLIAILMTLALVLSLGTAALAASYIYAIGDTNLREGPGLGYSILTSVTEGTRMVYRNRSDVDGRGVKWYYVSYNGRDAWVSSRYTTFSGGSSSSSGSSSRRNSGGSGTVFAEGGSTKVRTGPGLGYAEIGTLFQGDSAAYLGESRTDSRGVAWYRIRFEGGSGWVSSRYTSLNGRRYNADPAPAPDPDPAPAPDPKPAPPAPKGGTVYAEGGSTKVRTGPGLGYAEIGTLYQGNSLSYLGESRTDSRGVAWYRVSYRGGSGWVSSRYTTLY